MDSPAIPAQQELDAANLKRENSEMKWPCLRCDCRLRSPSREAGAEQMLEGVSAEVALAQFILQPASVWPSFHWAAFAQLKCGRAYHGTTHIP
ncbi:hypothetical protein EJB05_05349 [Eragrostis curvula]|uniref:Uncharacterized protein n=1 Tax=Eragrostis curvula TaxID=38414 RepID=A0A5J9WD63_9POAL|nr:hypothetical protein EJB05_05349 [Eragrostis curvula]